ncbi:hypothetical protein CYMTET_10858 [Cymbomonas tetramitiformis]|uniref:Protein ENHANCED DISEASE RESISTANCE 2 C-terminal domain-containing protein n=1 Tax=Cymbomonas tetramitiformis TaxID=36881 RepID=A0AAE0GNF5_9CHLO|nr:hypothetical protein CYMTET_10858 [Cymbomonas tetramitiformis]|eukprot:gene11565-13664_t
MGAKYSCISANKKSKKSDKKEGHKIRDSPRNERKKRHVSSSSAGSHFSKESWIADVDVTGVKLEEHPGTASAPQTHVASNSDDDRLNQERSVPVARQDSLASAVSSSTKTVTRTQSDAGSEAFFDAEDDFEDAQDERPCGANSDAEERLLSEGMQRPSAVDSMETSSEHSRSDKLLLGCLPLSPAKKTPSSFPPPSPSSSRMWLAAKEKYKLQKKRLNEVLNPSKPISKQEGTQADSGTRAGTYVLLPNDSGTSFLQAERCNSFHAGGSPGLRPDHHTLQNAWEECNPAEFSVRSKTYMKTKKKTPAEGLPLYGLVAMDCFKTSNKVDHVLRRLSLPVHKLPPDVTPTAMPGLLPWLVVNYQIPIAAPSMFGGSKDGDGYSMVLYYVLRPDVAESANEAQLGFFQRLQADGQEVDGERSRDRLKLIPRIGNVEQVTTEVMTSSYEKGLVKQYNGKPILMRPQNRYYKGDAYFEIDVDMYLWPYLARQGFLMFLPRINRFIFDFALVMQGNTTDELPEVCLAVARIYRLDFSTYDRYTLAPSGC